jgi:hypothetical protein
MGSPSATPNAGTGSSADTGRAADK